MKHNRTAALAFLPVCVAVAVSIAALEARQPMDKPTPCPMTRTLDGVKPALSISVAEATPAPDSETVTLLARLIWGEGRGVSDTEKAAIVWCVLNRTEDERWPDTVAEVVTAPGQFEGYSPAYPATEEHKAIAREVLAAWQNGGEGVLPREYVFFTGDGVRNTFRTEFQGGETMTFDGKEGRG